MAAQLGELIRGIGCGCAPRAAPSADPYGIRIYEGKYSDAYLQRADVQRGYTLVIWRGRHVSEPTELDEAEAAGYWAEVLAVARALITVYEPPEDELRDAGRCRTCTRIPYWGRPRVPPGRAVPAVGRAARGDPSRRSGCAPRR